MTELTRIFTVEITEIEKLDETLTVLPRKDAGSRLKGLLDSYGFSHVHIVGVQDFPFEKNQEQAPAPKLSRDEYNFLRHIEEGYIARDKGGSLFWYENYPEKRYIEWYDNDSFFEIKDFNGKKFLAFIRWEDDVALSVEELLELEVEKPVKGECRNCKHEDRRSDEYPCSKCVNNHVSKFEWKGTE